MSGYKFISVLLLGLAAYECQAFEQPPFLTFLFKESDPLIDGYKITGEVRELPLFVQSASRLCARGMWTLFTAPHFGELEDTTVFSVHGRGAVMCTTGSVASIIGQIKSIRPLGALTTRVNACTYFNSTKFVGPVLGCPSAASVETAGSIAYYLETSHAILCNTTTTPPAPTHDCVCLNSINSGSYVIPDTSNFAALSGKILYASLTNANTHAQCLSYRSVEIPTQSQLEITNLGRAVVNPTNFW